MRHCVGVSAVWSIDSVRHDNRGSGINTPNAFQVIYSSEIPCAELAQLDSDQRADPNAFGAVAQMRLRTLPVLGPMPAIFGVC
jgi:hypothetical protein